MKFTIRDLLWLTVVVALGLAWWVDRGRQAAFYQARSGALELLLYRHGFRALWRDQDVLAVPLTGKGTAYRSPTDPDSVAKWQRSYGIAPPPNSSAPAPNPGKD